MGSVITDETIEPLAYAVCNTDGVEGLSWAEVEACEVSKNKSKDLEFYYLVLVKDQVPWVKPLTWKTFIVAFSKQFVKILQFLFDRLVTKNQIPNVSQSVFCPFNSKRVLLFLIVQQKNLALIFGLAFGF